MTEDLLIVVTLTFLGTVLGLVGTLLYKGAVFFVEYFFRGRL
ncbi:MAG: hypothetical protein WCO52_02370 [bacterium]